MKTFIVVPQQFAYVVESFGKYKATLDAGFHFLVPFMERVAYKNNLKEVAYDVPPQECITSDNVSVEVDGILYLKIMDPYKASYGIDNYLMASAQLAKTTLRSEIGKLSLEETFSEREMINSNVVSQVDEATDPWGIKVTRYEIKNITPPRSVLHEMEQQMKAEREKRAEITLSEGERQSRINRSEGEKMEAINISQGEKFKRINEAEGRAASIEIMAEASAQGIKLISEAISQKGGLEAVDLRIIQEYIDSVGEILATNKTTVLPTNVASILSFFEGVSKVTGKLPQLTPKGGK
ncbi:MAG: paraslipin [Leptospiraceae bacterium]|nr:paraslipin [Leptospiraceae bacterium]MCP5502843.1 paraslipin [Leptospiraceae bacterium]